MKLIHRLSLFVIIAMVAIPLVILAQDQPTPPSNDDDLFVPIQTIEGEDLFVPIPTQDTGDNDLFVPIQTIEGEDLFVPLPEPDTCGNDDPTTEFVPICPPTKTPAPRPTAQPSTSIINGMWVLDPSASSFQASGQCQIPGGDNGGPDGSSEGIEELPHVPVCMTKDQQWVTVNGGAYPVAVPNTYSQSAMARELLETNGETTSTVNVTTIRQYRVISPTEIEYAYIRREQGGCTTTSTMRYRLVEANDMVCSGVVMTPDYTPVPTQMPTPQPGETQQPPVTPEPPLKVGEYTVQIPSPDDQCKAEQLPKSAKLQVNYDNNQNMAVNFGGGSYTLFWNGADYYEYHKGPEFMIGITVYPGGAALSWGNNGCFMNSPLQGAGLPPKATSTPVTEPTQQPTLDTASLAGTQYAVNIEMSDVLCKPENKAMLPDLSGAVLTAQADNTFVFSAGGISYTLADMGGIIAYTQTNGDDTLLTISLSNFNDEGGSGGFMVMTEDGSKSCIAQLRFTPKD